MTAIRSYDGYSWRCFLKEYARVVREGEKQAIVERLERQGVIGNLETVAEGILMAREAMKRVRL